MTVGGLFVKMALFSVVGAVLGLFVLPGASGAFLGIFLGFFPLSQVKAAAKKRNDKLSQQLTEGLDLMSRGLKAGQGFTDCLKTVAEEMDEPIADEFGRVYQEHHLGRELRACMENLAKRNQDNFSIRLMVSSVLLQRETGGNLVEILENISGTIRERFIFKAKVRALTSEAKASAIVMAALPLFVAGVITLFKPTYLAPLFNDPLGVKLLTLALFLYGLGIYSIKKVAEGVEL